MCVVTLQGECLFSCLWDHIFLSYFGRLVALTVSTTEHDDSQLSSNCFLLITYHAKLSLGNWSDSVCPVGMNSGQELDPLKDLLEEQGGTGEGCLSSREFSGEKGGWEVWLRLGQEWEAPGLKGRQKAGA